MVVLLEISCICFFDQAVAEQARGDEEADEQGRLRQDGGRYDRRQLARPFTTACSLRCNSIKIINTVHPIGALCSLLQ